MNNRFKQLENEVYNDMIAHMERTGGISDFKPKYTTRITRTQIPVKAPYRQVTGEAKGSYTCNKLVTFIRPYNTDYNRPPTEEESQAYQLLKNSCNYE